MEKKSELEPYFSVENVTYDIEKGGREIPTVYCSDILGYIRKVSVARALNDDNLHKKIGLDMGKKVLKCTLTLFSDEEVSGTKIKKRKEFTSTGSKKVLILVAVPNLSENYSNIKILLNLLKLRLLDSYWITG